MIRKHNTSAQLVEMLVDVRRDIHRYPELAFEERRTSDLVANWLQGHGLEIHRGLAETGIVGTLRRGGSDRAIALRADMDALPMQELNDFEHRSRHEGRFHGCGHDGHTAMLMGAAARLAAEGGFDGTIHFIFQPAEESAGGARKMIEDGLFERFPVAAVYGLHNFPAHTFGSFSARSGPFMAAYAEVDITLHGRGGHAAFPHLTRDPVPAAAAIVQGVQTIVSRSVDTAEQAAVSVTRLGAGDAYNVIPETVRIGGSYRYFSDEIGDLIGSRLTELADHITAAHGCTAETTCTQRYPVLKNSEKETRAALDAAARVNNVVRVCSDAAPVMASEDFAFMLEKRPGAYLLLGSGGGPNACSVHNPHYDFNDEIIPIGVDWWVEVARGELPSA